MAAARCPSSLALMLLLLSCCAAAAVDAKLTHLHLYFHEVAVGAPNATAVNAVRLNKSSPAFGDVDVFDNKLREGPDPASRLIGRAQGFAVSTALDGSSKLSAVDFVFSGDVYAEYSGSKLAAQGQFDPKGGPSELSIVGGTGKLRFARGYMTNRLHSATNTSVVGVLDMYFTLLAH